MHETSRMQAPRASEYLPAEQWKQEVPPARGSGTALQFSASRRFRMAKLSGMALRNIFVWCEDHDGRDEERHEAVGGSLSEGGEEGVLFACKGRQFLIRLSSLPRLCSDPVHRSRSQAS